MALGLTKRGLTDITTSKPIEIVFLILSPLEVPEAQVRALALASRAAQSRYLLQALRLARTAGEALAEIRDWEKTIGPDSSNSAP